MGAATAARPEPANVRHASCSSQQQPAAAKWSVGQPGERRLRAAGAAGSWQDGGQRPRTATRGPPGPGWWAWPAQRGEAAPGGAEGRWRGARRRRRRCSQINLAGGGMRAGGSVSSTLSSREGARCSNRTVSFPSGSAAGQCAGSADLANFRFSVNRNG